MPPRIVETDVLVIGSGVSGLAAALAARESDQEVLIVAKGPLGGRSCSWYAGGQLSLHLPGEHGNDPAAWLADSPLTDKAVAQALAKEAPRQIENLSNYGLTIRRSKGGGYHIDNTEAGHAFSGISVITQMARAAKAAGISRLTGFNVAWLLTSDNRCRGALGFTDQGEFIVIAAKAVVLASGGACRMFQHTTNPPGITGDGYAMLLHAGAELTNLEFVRFFPLGLPSFRFPVHRPFRRFFDIEGLRALNAEGEDIFEKHLRQSIVEAMEGTYCRFVTMSSMVAKERRAGEVTLDFRHLPARTWSHFKSIGPAGLVKRFGGSEEMWASILKHRSARTAPIAQTFVGGAKVAATMATKVQNLFASGEVVSFHFDLSSMPRCEIGPLPCALTSGAIAGKHAGRAAARAKKSADTAAARPEIKQLQTILARKRGMAPGPLIKRIRQIMSLHGGALRTDVSLRAGLSKLNRLAPELARVTASGPAELGQATEAQNMALIAAATLHACLMREESRSEHFREDFPVKDNKHWRHNVVVRWDERRGLTFHQISPG